MHEKLPGAPIFNEIVRVRPAAEGSEDSDPNKRQHYCRKDAPNPGHRKCQSPSVGCLGNSSNFFSDSRLAVLLNHIPGSCIQGTGGNITRHIHNSDMVFLARLFNLLIAIAGI